MWNELCDNDHDAHTMKIIHRAVFAIAFCFLSFGAYAIATRFGAGVPPSSVAYGSQKPEPGATVFGSN